MEEIKKFLEWLIYDSKYHGIESDSLVYFEDWENEDDDNPYAPLIFDNVDEVIEEYKKEINK